LKHTLTNGVRNIFQLTGKEEKNMNERKQT